GRAQVIGVDLYAGGAEPVTWAKPATRVFEVATDKEAYDPGETAALVLKSPFQEGRALAVTEGPEGNAYQWLEVKGGSATLKVPRTGDLRPEAPCPLRPDARPRPRRRRHAEGPDGSGQALDRRRHGVGQGEPGRQPRRRDAREPAEGAPG